MIYRNLLANLLGHGSLVLIAVFSVPFYIKFLGIETYGYVAVFTLIYGFVGITDSSIGVYMYKEVSRYFAGIHEAQFIRDMLRTLEVAALIAAVLLVMVSAIGADLIASSWLGGASSAGENVSRLFLLMVLICALRLLEGPARAVLLAFKYHVRFNLVVGGSTFLRIFGAIGVIAWVSPTLTAFFLWQAFISLLSVALLRLVAYSSLPPVNRIGRFSFAIFKVATRYAGPTSVLTILVITFAQIDKILLIKLVEPTNYGVYAVATVAASLIAVVVAPINQSMFPSQSRAFELEDSIRFKEVFHRGAQMCSVLIASAATALFFFPAPILELWLGEPDSAKAAAPLTSVLAIGVFLSGLAPMLVQVHHVAGRFKHIIFINAFGIVVMAAAVSLVAPVFGMQGTAWVFVISNALVVSLTAILTFREYLIQEGVKWLVEDVITPIGTCLLVSGIIVLTTRGWDLSAFEGAMLAACMFFVALMPGFFLNRYLRRDIILWLQQRFSNS